MAHLAPAACIRPTKVAARACASVLGYTVHHDTSSSGDHGYGSREYWTRPDTKRNHYGWPLSLATISRVGRNWHIDFSEVAPALAIGCDLGDEDCTCTKSGGTRAMDCLWAFQKKES